MSQLLAGIVRVLCCALMLSMCSTDSVLELEVPPDHGNGLDNAGIPLSKLLFFLKDTTALLVLIEALLYER